MFAVETSNESQLRYVATPSSESSSTDSSTDTCSNSNAKQKHPGCKKVQAQSEAAL